MTSVCDTFARTNTKMSANHWKNSSGPGFWRTETTEVRVDVYQNRPSKPQNSKRKGEESCIWVRIHYTRRSSQVCCQSSVLRRKTKQINHVQICYKRGSGEDLAWTTRSTILTGLAFLPSSCLIRLPIHSFSGGNYKNSWSTLLKGSQLVSFTLPFYLDWGVISSQDLSMKIIYTNGKFWSLGEAASLSLVLHGSDRVVADHLIPSSTFRWSRSPIHEFHPFYVTSEGGFFQAILTFPPEFPLLPPKLRFKTPMWHPNSEHIDCDRHGLLIIVSTVYEDGTVCISILVGSHSILYL